MITPEPDHCEYCRKLRDIQLKYIHQIKAEFKNTVIWESNKLQDEPVGIEGLRNFAKEVYKDLGVEQILKPKS